MKLKVSVFGILFLVFSLQSVTLIAQQRTVFGKVTTFQKYPLKKVTIKVDGTEVEALTDTAGIYSIECDAKDKLQFIANGFNSQKVNLKKVDLNDSVNVNLTLKKGDKNFQYATGYGYIDEKRLSYAIQHFESQPDYSSYSSIFNILEGRVSGISVGQNSIKIRGTSLMNGESSALLVVDGSIVEFSIFKNIPPSQVKSIDVLKGAAASARYGTRGMGGVIVVTTKSKN